MTTQIEKSITEQEFIEHLKSKPLGETWGGASAGVLALGGQFAEVGQFGLVRLAFYNAPEYNKGDVKDHCSVKVEYRFNHPMTFEEIHFDNNKEVITTEFRRVHGGSAKNIRWRAWKQDVKRPADKSYQEDRARALRILIPSIVAKLEEGETEVERLTRRIQSETLCILRKYGVKERDRDAEENDWWGNHLPRKYLEDVAQHLEIKPLVDAAFFSSEIYSPRARSVFKNLVKSLQV